MSLTRLSIIIPLGPEEDQLAPLLADLAQLPAATEIILVACEGQEPEVGDKPVRWLRSEQGRALQQNVGAKAATGAFLWFLHADSRVTPEALAALERSLKVAPEALHYFHLKFKGDGPRAMGLNEAGAWFRSEILGVPFGDQGFCLGKDIFARIGGFNETAAFGEDHLLVWQARQAGVKLRCVGASLPTSARKYSIHGWGALTLKYQLLWLRQAAPELVKLLRLRLRLTGQRR
ncbi:MAG: glycosyltransferase family 2 protein [Rhodobacteraceae bacterium]|nr:glycosyltransferase family 2 protein [Paracoccaceae bacterium]